MKVEIEYCGQWGYEPRAREAQGIILKAHPTATIALKRGGGGVFEIVVDGKLAYSKKATGRFPTDGEIAKAVG